MNDEARKALADFKLPFSIYHNEIEIGDENGHVCTAENPEIAKAIVDLLNRAALRAPLVERNDVGKCTFPDCDCIAAPPCPHYAHSPSALAKSVPLVEPVAGAAEHAAALRRQAEFMDDPEVLLYAAHFLDAAPSPLVEPVKQMTRPPPTNSPYSTERLAQQLMDSYEVCGDQVFYQASTRLTAFLETRATEPATHSPLVGREALHQAAKEGNLQYWRDAAKQDMAFKEWKAGGFNGDGPRHMSGTLVDYIVDAILAALPAQAVVSLPPLMDRSELVGLLEDLASVNLSREACSKQANRMADDLIARGVTFTQVRA